MQMTGTVVSKQVGPVNATGDAVYEYLGCYSDTSPAGRLLPNLAYDNASNTDGLCQTACLSSRQYPFAGTEYQSQCFCGNTPPSSQYLDTTNTKCTYSCTGDAGQACGGVGGYISVYYDPTKYTPGGQPATLDVVGPPTQPNPVLNYNYVGCWNESASGRALSDSAPPIPTGGNTLENCATHCQGSTYFGMEYGNECYCGNSFGVGSYNQSSSDPTVNGCSMPCGGNQSEYCGGPSRLSTYMYNSSLPAPNVTVVAPVAAGNQPSAGVTVQRTGNWTYVGCYTEGTGGRALTGLANPVPAGNVTVESCTAACQGYALAGVEYGREW